MVGLKGDGRSGDREKGRRGDRETRRRGDKGDTEMGRHGDRGTVTIALCLRISPRLPVAQSPCLPVSPSPSHPSSLTLCYIPTTNDVAAVCNYPCLQRSEPVR